MHAYTHKYTHIHTYTHMYTGSALRIHAHTHTHTHTHTCIQAARSAYRKASSVQARRGKKPTKMTMWLLSIAAKYGKLRVRNSVLDIQRLYRGMLGRLDARYERMAKRCVCVCVCVYIHIYYTYIHTYIHTCIRVSK
jgi:hypothetical protein